MKKQSKRRGVKRSTKTWRKIQNDCGENARFYYWVRPPLRVLQMAENMDISLVIDWTDEWTTGSGESGKSTIVKQMKIIHLKGYSDDELYNYRPTVFKNLIECAKAVINAMRQFDIEPEKEENKALCDFLLEYSVESGPQAMIDPKVGQAVQAVWSDPAREQLMDRQTEFYLMDSAE